MVKKLFFVFIWVGMSLAAYADDSIKTVRPRFVALQIADGFTLPTDMITPGKHYEAPHLSAFTFKYGMKARGDTWQDAVYGMPYKGIGIYVPRFTTRKKMGDPFSVFLFQGAEIKRLSPSVSLHYEIDLGVSFNWNYYDIREDPYFIALGSPVNVHLGGAGYVKWSLSDRIGLHTGISFSHFSNGAIRTPNNGINLLTAFVEVAYDLYGKTPERPLPGYAPPPAFSRHVDHDLSFMLTTKTLKNEDEDNESILKYPRQRFTVAGISYSYLFHTTRRFKWGPSVEAVYDESSNAEFRSTISASGKEREIFKMGKTADRFSLGLSAKGELAMPGYSIFAHLGCDVYHKNKRDSRIYQIYGLKVYLTGGLFATFGVRSTEGTKSQYLYLNAGYSF